MKSIFILASIALFALSCKEDAKQKAYDQSKTPALGIIEGYPEDIRGCTCALSKTEEDFKNQKFIYLEKYGATDSSKNFKFVKIDEELVKWSTEPPKDFNISLDYDSEESKNPELTKKTGILKLNFNDNTTIETPFVGYCGC